LIAAAFYPADAMSEGFFLLAISSKPMAALADGRQCGSCGLAAASSVISFSSFRP